MTCKQAVYLVSNFDKTVAFDIETKGTNAAKNDCQIVGIGFADSKQIVYIDRATCEKGAWPFLFKKLAEFNTELVAHNMFFDSAFLTRDYPELTFNFKYCTYGLLRQLANEGWDGQTWGLKDAQMNLLKWEESNEGELHQWLVENGYFAEDAKKEPSGNHQYPIINEKGRTRFARPRKEMMFLAPPEILGYYCGLDCASTYLLLSNIFAPALTKLPPTARQTFDEYHSIFMVNVKILVEQQLYGTYIDKEKLLKYHEDLLGRIEGTKDAFFTHPEIAEKIAEFKARAITELKEKEPEKYKVHKLPVEPKKLTKSGQISKNWEKWKKKIDEDTGPEISKNWISWTERVKHLEDTYSFNLNSAPQLRELFYEKFQFPIILTTKSELPATDGQALSQMGEKGKLLKDYKDLVKEEGYVHGCISKLAGNYLNLQFRVPGTLTGRLAGSGGLNVQQLPKSRGYLECWKPRPGYAWIDCDVNSLEQVVLTELSQDPALLSLYGPGAKEQDVYLFNGADMAGIGPKIREYYDPDNPTPESIALAKKKCKNERSISKVITLASSYGAGAKKLYSTLQLSGVDIHLDAVERMVKSYWDKYQGVREYERKLLKEWEARGGWVYNGIGRPICIDDDKTKDIVNRVVQSTGHDILMMIIAEMDSIRRRELGNLRRLMWRPIIIDFHDESLVECREDDIPVVMEMFKEAYQTINKKLNASVQIEGEPEVIQTLADAKVEG